MAKTNVVMRQPKQGLTYEEVSAMMQVETASIVTDYIRQYVGVATETPTPGSGIFINQDRVLRTQSYQETAWYDLYAEVEKDPHVAAILQTRRMAVAGLPWDMMANDPEDARQAEIAEFVKKKLKQLENFNQDVYELLDAIGKGFAVSEIVWMIDRDRAVVPKVIMNRPQRRFQFDATNRSLKLRNVQNPYFGDPLPERKFICHRGSTVWENPFGDALDQKLYWMWLFKKTVLTFWMKKNEVDMSSVPLVQHPASANPALKAEAMEIAENIRVGAFGRIPDNFSVIWAESNSAANAVQQYHLFVELCNAEMTKCVLGQTLTTEGSGSDGAGSKALGEVHDKVRGDIIDFDTKAIEGTLNATLIRWLVDLNYGEQDEYPRFIMSPEEASDQKYSSEVLKNLSSMGFKPTREWIEEHFDIELDEEEVEEPIVGADGNPVLDPFGKPVTTKKKVGAKGKETEATEEAVIAPDEDEDSEGQKK